MKFWSELAILTKTVSPWFWVFGLLSFWFFAVHYPGSAPLSVLVIRRINQDFLSPQIKLIVTAPTDAFVTQALVSFFLAFGVSFPLLLLRIAAFISPGLYSQEKGLLLATLLPSSLFFVFGSIFAYTWILPLTLKILYTFSQNLGAESLITLKTLTSFVLGIILLTGLVFQLPLLMNLLDKAGVVKTGFWRRYSRHAVASALIFTAAVTPDGSGVTMLILAAPIIALYFLGLLLTARR